MELNQANSGGPGTAPAALRPSFPPGTRRPGAGRVPGRPDRGPPAL